MALASAGASAGGSTTVWHVDDSIARAGDGLAWPTAMKSLQAALAAAQPGDQIRIAQGTYRPAGFFGDRTVSFMLGNGIAVRGGYAGFDAADPEARDPLLFPTILSGDLNGDDDGSQVKLVDNSFHVVRALDGAGRDSTLDGVTIEAGVSYNFGGNNTSDNAVGAGLLLLGAQSPAISNCVLTDNWSWYGGAMACKGSKRAGTPDPLVDGCTIRGNHTFPGNGGATCAVLMLGSAGQWSRCRIEANNCGGVRAESWEGLFSDCSISFNIGDGAAITQSAAQFINCTIFRNIGKGLLILPEEPDQPTVVANCILWSNFDCNLCGAAAASYSTMPETEVTGPGVIHANPLVVSPLGPDGLPGTGDEDLRLGAASPCIDAASNDAVLAGTTLDLAAAARFVDDPEAPDSGLGNSPVVDMGAFERQAEKPPPPPPCPADIAPVGAPDGVVNIDDLLAVINGWGPCPPPERGGCPADIAPAAAPDGQVNIDDLLSVINAWGPCG